MFLPLPFTFCCLARFLAFHHKLIDTQYSPLDHNPAWITYPITIRTLNLDCLTVAVLEVCACNIIHPTPHHKEDPINCLLHGFMQFHICFLIKNPPQLPEETDPKKPTDWKKIMDSEIKVLGEILQYHKCMKVCHKYGNEDQCWFQFSHDRAWIIFWCQSPILSY